MFKTVATTGLAVTLSLGIASGSVFAHEDNTSIQGGTATAVNVQSEKDSSSLDLGTALGLEVSFDDVLEDSNVDVEAGAKGSIQSEDEWDSSDEGLLGDIF